MALNPPLIIGAGVEAPIPAAVPGELFLLMRKGISGSFTVPGIGKVKGKGVLYMTTLRLVFVATPPVADKAGHQFSAFDMPVAYISNEKFNQPIFGANNLSGTCEPITEMGLQGPTTFKLTFRHGGCGTFLHSFLRLVAESRAAAQRNAAMAATAFTQTVVSGQFQQQAYVDPNDPSVIFVSQPAAVAAAPPANYAAYPGMAKMGANPPPPAQGGTMAAVPVAQAQAVPVAAVPVANQVYVAQPAAVQQQGVPLAQQNLGHMAAPIW